MEPSNDFKDTDSRSNVGQAMSKEASSSLEGLKEGRQRPETSDERPSDGSESERRSRTAFNATTGGDSRHCQGGAQDCREKDDPADTALFVQELLPTMEFDEEGLRQHLCMGNLKSYPTRKALGVFIPGVDDMPMDRENAFDLFRIKEKGPPLRPMGDLVPRGLSSGADRSRCQIFEVGPDGRSACFESKNYFEAPVESMSIWQALRSVPFTMPSAVGRITIVNELNPSLLAALHYVTSGIFPLDQVFQALRAQHFNFARMLITERRSVAFPDTYTFDFGFRYLMLVDSDYSSFDWQNASPRDSELLSGLRLSTYSSYVCLALSGDSIREIERSVNGISQSCLVYDPFASWQVLDFKNGPRLLPRGPEWHLEYDMDTKRCGSGPEAFMLVFKHEIEEASRRLESVFDAVSDLVTQSEECIWEPDVLDEFLSTKDSYSIAKRCLWISSVFDALKETIREVAGVYEGTFTDDVWEGKHASIWPLRNPSSQQSTQYRKRMAVIRSELEQRLDELKDLSRLIDQRQREIVAQEARRSALAADAAANASTIAVLQGRNIRILTTVSIFFLPLTYVTSVFGMANMDPNQGFSTFGIVTVAICVPFFILMASLISKRGFAFWERNFKAALRKIEDSWSRLWAVVGRSEASQKMDEETEYPMEETRVPEGEPEAVLGAAREDVAQSKDDRRVHGVRSRLFGLRSRFKRDSGGEQMV